MKTKYTAIIIDNCKLSAKLLANHLEKFHPNIELLKTVQDFNNGITSIEHLGPDIVFLETKINNSTAFEMLDTITNINPQFIFISKDEKYAVEAYRYYPVGFLLKPFSLIKLRKFINKAIQNLEVKHQKQQEAKESKHGKDYITISTNKCIRLIKLNEIMFCESDGNYTSIYLKDEEKVLCSGNIGHYENLLSKDIFMRIHKKYLVNLSFIKAIYKSANFYCELINKKLLPISRRKQEGIRRQLINA